MMDQPESVIQPNSRYRRRNPLRSVSWTALVIGVLVGAGLGLYHAWYVSPIVEVNTSPWQLEPEARSQYMVAVALSFAYNSDLDQATTRLLDVVRTRDPFQEVADIACELARTGYVNNSSGLRAIRSMRTFYQLQGRTGCADDLVQFSAAPTTEVEIILPTPTPLPVATKTPTPEATRPPTSTPVPIVVPTNEPVQQYVLVNVATFCDTEISGVIEVYVQDFNGEGIPGQPVRARWDGGEDVFYTGLKPERGTAYTDFQMEPDVAYTLDMPDRSEAATRQLVAVPCTTEFGERAITSYRAVFRPEG